MPAPPPPPSPTVFCIIWSPGSTPPQPNRTKHRRRTRMPARSASRLPPPNARLTRTSPRETWGRRHHFAVGYASVSLRNQAAVDGETDQVGLRLQVQLADEVGAVGLD